MTDALPALLIANEESRRGGEVQPFAAALERGGMRLVRRACGSAAETCETILSMRGEVSAVLLGGGDGTMHGAAPALRDSGLPLGILPLGTANDLARSLGIVPRADGAAAAVLGGRTRAIDLGTVNTIPFFNVASLGLSVSITKRLSGLMKRRLGVLAYPVAAGAAVLRRRRFVVSLRADGGEVVTKSLQVSVGNGRFYGGGTVVDEDAQVDDGMLHVYSLEPRHFWRLLFMARAFRAGQHRRIREVRTLTCRTLSVVTRHPHEISADGEIVGRTPAEFGVLPGAVRVFVP